MADVRHNEQDEQTSSAAGNVAKQTLSSSPGAETGENLYADASHWMRPVSADGSDHVESGGKLDFTDIDFTVIGKDATMPDRGTAHSFGRKVNIALCAIAFVVLFGYLFIAGEGEDTVRALTSFNWVFLLLVLVIISPILLHRSTHR